MSPVLLTQGAKRAELVKRFVLRSFWTAMIDMMPFEAAEGGEAVLSVRDQALPGLSGRKKVAFSWFARSTTRC